jgi:phospholipase/carboxylesterase
MAENLTPLLQLMDTLARIARMMDPRRLQDLVELLGDQDNLLQQAIGSLTSEPAHQAATLVLEACAGLRASTNSDSPFVSAIRAMRQYSRAQEALAALMDVPEVGRYLLEPACREDEALLQRLAAPPHPDSGVFHFSNQTDQRGGFSVFVPSWYDPTVPVPLIMALHGGSGHGRLFLWNWVPEARSRGMIVVSPTAVGRTWSLTEPEIDSRNLDTILAKVRDRWNIDPGHMLLTGMSDGGTFTLLSGLAPECPFTHLAPVATSFHPLMMAVTEPARLSRLPVHLTHGALDWMFPVDNARYAFQTLLMSGAAVTYRQIPDLSHAYPRDAQGEVLDWMLGSPTDAVLFHPA